MVTVKQVQPKDLNLDDAPAKRCDVFLVDGNGLAFRAFYALPEELQTVDGQPTNALLGTANMLMRLLMDYRPQTVLVAWAFQFIQPAINAAANLLPPTLPADCSLASFWRGAACCRRRRGPRSSLRSCGAQL